MGKLKELFFKLNAKVPIIKVLIWATLAADVFLVNRLAELFTFEPNFLVLYGLEDAGKVRSRVEEQMRRYKPKPPPAPPPPALMSYEVRLLRQHNPFLEPGMVEQMGIRDDTQKVTDVSGIDLIGTVYSYTPKRRSALIELNGVAMVVLEGSKIRGTQKRVTEIGRSRITVQEERLIPSPVYLPGEHGLDDLQRSLASNEMKTQSNWEYSARGGVKARKGGDGDGDDGGGDGGGDGATDEKKAADDGGKKGDTKGGKSADKAAADEAAADEAAAAEEEEEEPATSSRGGGGGGGGGGGRGGDEGGGMNLE